MRHAWLIGLLLAWCAAADDTGKRYASASDTTAIGGGEIAWINTSNAHGSDTATYSLAALGPGGISEAYRARGYDFSDIVAGSILEQIDLYIYRQRSGAGAIEDYLIQLIDGSGTLAGANKVASAPVEWPSTAGERTAITWSAGELSTAGIDLSDVQSSSFGVAIQCEEVVDDDADGRLYYVALVITYAPPAVSDLWFLFYGAVVGAEWRVSRWSLRFF